MLKPFFDYIEKLVSDFTWKILFIFICLVILLVTVFLSMIHILQRANYQNMSEQLIFL